MATTPKKSCHNLVLPDKVEDVLMRFINASNVVIEPLSARQKYMPITDMSDLSVS